MDLRMRSISIAAAVLFLPAAVVLADPQEQQPAQARAETGAAAQSMCLMVESAALTHGLPLEFFARVIWQESRFQTDATGPVTRSGERAEGIAQFMPRTAAERGLLNPYDPVQALPKSAEFLSELRREFGNLGLAAAAYNAGPQRVRDFLAGRGGIPGQTRAYVLAITGKPIEDWAAPGTADADNVRAPGCRDLMAMLKREPNLFVRELEQRVTAVAAAPWGVQLSAGFSRDRALRSYAAIAKHYENLLRGHDPSIISSRLLSRGTRTFYQVRAGAPTRATADGLCGSIRRAGGACLVLKNKT
jgi:hypothetical protein